MLSSRDRAHLLVVDIQAKLVPTIHEATRLIERSKFLIKTAKHLHVPVTVTEQYPKGLGPTEGDLLALCGHDTPVFAKTAFSAMKDDAIRDDVMRDASRTDLVIIGMEAHVCVLQTAMDALAHGLNVFVVTDAVGSRNANDPPLAFARLRHAGASLVSAEMIFFEWLERSGTDEFKALSPMLKA
jgi:isochorismate hydrolase